MIKEHRAGDSLGRKCIKNRLKRTRCARNHRRHLREPSAKLMQLHCFPLPLLPSLLRTMIGQRAGAKEDSRDHRAAAPTATD